ncbi:MAG: undecaprenyldiphospho-muramoylpentapeptide beta-N-acetylglucosaminyltransferase [Spirochaetota bacterium]
MKNIKIVITGGGTGGHTSPAISIINYLKKKSNENLSFDILYIGSKNGIEKDYTKKEGIRYLSINTGKLRRSISIKNISDMFKVLIGIFDARKILSEFKPDIVFSTGGYVSVPVVLAAKSKNIPLIIHEQTVNVGLANKIASKVADKVAVTFESSKEFFPEEKVILTGMPLREEIFEGDKEECYNLFSLDKSLPLLYITGGSQGSKFINDTIAVILPELLTEMNIIHQCGGKGIHNSYDELNDIRDKLSPELKTRYVVKDYIYSELKHIFKTADLIVGRSGAGTINECIALSLPAIYIPLPGTTRNEQVQNAKLVENIGGAVVLYQQETNPQTLLEQINELMGDKERLSQMKEKLKAQESNANEKIFNLIMKYAKNTTSQKGE